jgi:hypothetical protein
VNDGDSVDSWRVSVGQACSTREVHLYAQTAQSPKFRYLANMSTPRLLFPMLPRYQNSLFCQNHQKHQRCTKGPWAPTTTTCIDNDHAQIETANTRMRSSSICSCRLNSCVLSREGEGEGHEKGRSDSIVLFDGLSTHLEDPRSSQKATTSTTRLSIPLSTTSYSFH